MKRFFDLISSLFLIVLLSPLFLLLILILYLFQGNPIFFVQERPGLNSKIFKIIKFRTMKMELNNDNDISRITKIGRYYRELSLDELPELINILMGEMSFVGPRPLLIEYLKYYNTEQIKRHLVKPGITGWAQINGRNAISWNDKFKLDLWYVSNQSFLLDIKIIFITLFKLLKRENINNKSGKIPPKFNGLN